MTINAEYTSTYQGQIFGGLSSSDFVSLQGDAQADAAINAALNQISSQFKNSVTVNILFEGVHGGTTGPTAFLAASSSGQTLYTYNQYTSALATDAAANKLNNKALNTAVANLGFGNGASDPNNSYVAATTADARMLGLDQGANTTLGVGDSTPEFDINGKYLGGGGQVDGIVYLNIDQPLSYTRPIQPVSAGVTYDVQQSLEHETDEMLGIGGQGSQLNSFNAALVAGQNFSETDWGVSGEVYGPMDLYRYQFPGVPSYDPIDVSIEGCKAGPGSPCTGLSAPYFSVNGGLKSIDTFNQAFPLIGGDAGDWGLNLYKLCPGGLGEGGKGDVQDAFSCNNEEHDVVRGSPAYAALEAVGYDPAVVPEPGTWAILLAGFGGLGSALRRRRRGLARA